MLASVLLIFAYPIAVVLFIVLFLVMMEPTRDKVFNS
jgi:thiosulfate dehydrogenase (quinone) large subunit